MAKIFLKVQKKVPMRKCVISNKILPKKELIRIVKTNDGKIFVDHNGKINGRGIYLQPKLNLVMEAMKTKIIEKNLKVKITDDIYQKIIFEIKNYWD